MSRPVSVSRDPFARASLYRLVIRFTAGAVTCGWCGSGGRLNGRGRARLFRYAWSPDDRSSAPPLYSIPFCSVSCYRVFFE